MALNCHGLTITFEPDGGGSFSLALPNTHDLVGELEAGRGGNVDAFQPVLSEYGRAIDRGGRLWQITFTTARRWDSYEEASIEWAANIETQLDEVGAGTLTIARPGGAASFAGAVCQTYRVWIPEDNPNYLFESYVFITGRGEIGS